MNLYKDYKPFSFFSFLAGFLSLTAIFFMIPVLLEFWHTGLVERFPTLIVCGFVMVAALQSFFAGLILHNLTVKNRRDFEYRYHQVADETSRSKPTRLANTIVDMEGF